MRDHAIDSANSPWNPPQAFEEYRLVCPLSRGAMGEVYLAHDTLLERPVAIKFIIAMGDSGPSPEVREQFLTEARAAARLQHPNVVTIYRVSEIDKRPLIISEFVRGQNLDSVPKPVPWQRAQELGLGLARGLAAAHRRGVLHLDIKPGNVILSNEGEVKLLDFGLARLLDLGYGNAASTTSAAAFAGITNSAPKPMAATVEFTGDHAKRLMSSPLAVNLARSIAQTERSSEADQPTAVDPLVHRLVVEEPIDADGPTDQLPRDYETSELAVTVSPDLNQMYLAPTEAEHGAPSQISERRAALVSTMNGPVPSELTGPRPRRRPPAPSQVASQGSTSGSEALQSTGQFRSPTTGQITAPERSSSLDSAEFSALDWELPPTSEKSRIAGTPLYMAPEIWRGEPGTRRADIYSMGALLYELLHGVPPFADVQLATLAKVVNEQDAPPLLSVAPTVDARMAAIVDRCLRRDPAQRFGSGDELREALEQLRVKDSGTAAPEGNPYRGLLAFEAEHRGLFFGRRSEIGTITERLRTEPLVLVAADSGVGKSSLCRAGVLPTVSEGALGKGRKWSTLAMVPGRTPLTALCSELASHVGLAEAELMAQVTAEPPALARLLHRGLGDSRGLLLFIDQLEEMVTIAEPAQSRIVGEALGHLCARIPAVRMLMTVRSDFLARVAAVGGLGDELVRALYILRPLTPDKIQEAIVGPAQIKGVSFESQELVDRLVESTAKTDGGLPLLQFALTELWEARKGDSITKAALDAIGGVGGALARHADQVMLALPADQRKEARRILMALVTMEGTRARRSDDELPRTPAARQALEVLVKARLLVARDTGEGASYEVAHEALLKGWDSLRKWLEDHAERRAAKQRLETAAAEWARLGKTREALWSKLQITDADLLEEGDITPREAEFIGASRRKHWRDRQLRRALAILIPSLLVAMYGGYRIKLSRDLSHRVESHMRDGRQLFAQAQRLDAEVTEQRQKAFTAFDNQKKEEGEKIWVRVLELSQELDELLGRTSQAVEAAVTLDGSRADARRQLAEVLYQRALGAERDHMTAKQRDLLARMDLYDISGSLAKQWNKSARVQIQTAPPGAMVRLGRYEENKRHRMPLVDDKVIGQTPLPPLELPQGSYLLVFSAPGRAEIRYPFVVTRGEQLTLNVDLPQASRIPDGYVYIPPGRFLFGTAEADAIRQSFLQTTPLHMRETPGYLIAKYETTLGQWIEFLNDLSPADRTKYSIEFTNAGASGAIGLSQLADGSWQLTLQAVNTTYTLRQGQPLIYGGRNRNKQQDWSKLPASGMDRGAAEAYTSWLRRSGRLSGARLCSELEWERAARGADAREHPQGNLIDGTEANIDESYGRDNMGPDEVGRFPASQSPFGVHDMAGNVNEWVRSALDSSEAVIKGGGFFYNIITARSTNHSAVPANIHDPTFGFRVCGDLPPTAP